MRFVSKRRSIELEVGDVVERKVLGKTQRYMIVSDGNKFKMLDLEWANVRKSPTFNNLGEALVHFKHLGEGIRIIKSEDLELKEV